MCIYNIQYVYYMLHLFKILSVWFEFSVFNKSCFVNFFLAKINKFAFYKFLLCYLIVIFFSLLSFISQLSSILPSMPFEVILNFIKKVLVRLDFKQKFILEKVNFLIKNYDLMWPSMTSGVILHKLKLCLHIISIHNLFFKIGS